MYIIALIWLALMIFFLFTEGQTIALVSLWFAIGALVALVSTLLGAPIWLQLLLFFLVSGALLASLRPLLKKFIRPKIVPTNVDAIIGITGYITTDVDNLTAQGQVKLAGMEWSARSTSGDPLTTGTLVRVDRIEGVKAFVTKVD